MSIPDPHYETGYHAERHADLIENDEYFWARADVQARTYFSAEERRRRIFEYGCGVGQGMAGLPNAQGWDVSGEARSACRARGLKVHDDLATVPHAAWDIVFCRHALEHIEAPLAALQAMRDLVAPEGELYLVLPRERHARASLEPDLNQHLYCWNFRTINNLVARAGMRSYVNQYQCMLGWHALLPIRRLFGAEVYYRATRLGVVLRSNAELIVRARLVPEAHGA